MIVGVLLPVLGLMLCAVVIPIGLERWVPESVAGMIVNGFLSGAIMTLLATGYFLWAYQRQDMRLLDAIGFAPGETFKPVATRSADSMALRRDSGSN